MTGMSDLPQLVERLKALDKLFVDLYDYAERERDKVRAGEGDAFHALNSIRHTIGGRYNVIPQAASAIDSLSSQVEELKAALRPFAEDADACHSATPDGHHPVIDYGTGSFADASFTIGDIRRARALSLEAGKE